MTDRRETPRPPDLEFPDTSASTADRTSQRFSEAPAIAAEIMAAAEAAQHGGNLSSEGSDKPAQGHREATPAEKPWCRTDEDWANVGRHE